VGGRLGDLGLLFWQYPHGEAALRQSDLRHDFDTWHVCAVGRVENKSKELSKLKQNL
jgi:hypothetical protein